MPMYTIQINKNRKTLFESLFSKNNVIIQVREQNRRVSQIQNLLLPWHKKEELLHARAYAKDEKQKDYMIKTEPMVKANSE